MDITFKCGQCGQHIVIDETGAGLQVTCPKCGFGTTVPKPIPFFCQNLPPSERRDILLPLVDRASLPSTTELVESFIPGEPSRYRTEWHGQVSEHELPASKPMGSYQGDIASLKFHGWFRDSLNGNYSVVWGTRNPVGGYFNEYFLLSKGATLIQAKRVNIQDAAVADNGSFIISDVSKSRKDLVTVFDVTGRKLRQIKPHCVYNLTFDLDKKVANMQLPADWAKYPPGRIAFSLVDGAVEIIKPCSRCPY